MARRCKQTKEPIPAFAKSETLWHKKGFASLDAMVEYGNNAVKASKSAQEKEKAKAVRQAKKAEKEARKRYRERRERIKTLKDHVSDTQALVNQVVVLEDRPKGCISCLDGVVTDAGHYFHRGSKYRVSPLTLERANLNGQCRACNGYKGGGNQHEYRLGYIRRYGQEAFDELCGYKDMVDRGEIPKLTVEECKKIQSWARAAIKQLKRRP